MRPLAAVFLIATLPGCASREGFDSPSGKVKVIHDQGSTDRPPSYKLINRDRQLIGTAPSIVDAWTITHVSGLPVSQTIHWSTSGRTAIIYENMSDASPEYRHILLRQRTGSEEFDAFEVNFDTRTPMSLPPYPVWPAISRVSDTLVTLEWPTSPKKTTVPISSIPLSNPVQ